MSESAALESFFWDPRFAMGEESAAIAQRVWPRFLSEGRLVAYANAVLLAIDANLMHLPEEGWQFAIEAGGRKETPNGLCMVVANVCPSAQKLRLSPLLIEKAKAEARNAGLTFMIAPVRPSHWHEREDLSFAQYVNLRRPDGLPTDPWLRAHERAGAERLNICHRSTVVTASTAKWSEWTGKPYFTSGAYPLERGLAPLQIDLAKGLGTYTEPNVWVRYRV